MSVTRLIVGAMSGTSADGVDVAIVRIEGSGFDMSPAVMAHHHRPYGPALRQAIFAARGGGAVKLADLADLGRQISLTYAAAVNELLISQELSAADLACVAAHGQTLYHDPPRTIQWFDPALVAAEVGCPVISDFRRADCAVGGQGAPLVPFADYVLFRHATKNRILVNIGGITNFTWLPAGADIEWLIAFDSGPGNCISDWLMRQFQPQGPGVDVDGQRAARGMVIEAAVSRMLEADYFWQRPPKSTDAPAMIDLFRSSFTGKLTDFQQNDILATACAITAETLVDAIYQFIPTDADEIVFSGGGTRNATMMERIRARLKGPNILTSDELGIRSDAKEAVAFALLAAATLDGIPANIPSVTGARRPVVLGAITPKP